MLDTSYIYLDEDPTVFRNLYIYPCDVMWLFNKLEKCEYSLTSDIYIEKNSVN